MGQVGGVRGVGSLPYHSLQKARDHFNFNADSNMKIISKFTIKCTLPSVKIVYLLNTSNLTCHSSKHHLCEAFKIPKLIFLLNTYKECE